MSTIVENRHFRIRNQLREVICTFHFAQLKTHYREYRDFLDVLRDLHDPKELTQDIGLVLTARNNAPDEYIHIAERI